MPSRASVKILDVAREAGVSTATVSRVLNVSDAVAPHLAERVLRAAAELHYVPNSTGRALRRQVSDMWAAVIPDAQNPFFTTLVSALQSVAEREGISVVLCNTDEQLVRERAYLTAAVAQRMSGALVAVSSESESDLSPSSMPACRSWSWTGDCTTTPVMPSSSTTPTVVRWRLSTC